MAKKKTAAITGVGAYLPDYILDNIELSQMVDTSDEWIMSRIGIKTRHILKGEGLGTSFMGEKAVLDLLEKTNTDPMDIEMVICATVTPDMFFPSTANLICYKTGMKQAFGFDLSAACSGFLFALNTASKYIEAGTHKKVIVIGRRQNVVDHQLQRPQHLPDLRGRRGSRAAGAFDRRLRRTGRYPALGRRRRPTPLHEGGAARPIRPRTKPSKTTGTTSIRKDRPYSKPPYRTWRIRRSKSWNTIS